MGQAIVKQKSNAPQPIPKLMDETQIFALWTLQDVKELLKKFRTQVFGFALVEAQFEMILAFKPQVAKAIELETLFEVLDSDHDGRIDGLQFLGGLALCCQAAFEEKARFCFELYDFNMNAKMSKKEMIMMMMASICGINMLSEGGYESEPSLEVLEALANDAFLRVDRDGTGVIGYEQFVAWARSNRDIMAALEGLNRMVEEAKVNFNPEDSAADTDEADLSDQELRGGVGKGKAAIKTVDHAGDLPIPTASATEHQKTDLSTSQWKGQIHEPTNHKYSKSGLDGPDTNLELHWAFGYRAQGCRHNLRYVHHDNPDTTLVVYSTAALGVVYDMQRKEQRFYQGHMNEITCLAIHPTGLLVATADIASEVHVWDPITLSITYMIRGIVKQGIQNIAFSPTQDRIVTVGRDSDHTVAIYDCSNGEIISSSKGICSPSTVNDLAYSPSGKELVLVGKKQIKFFKGVQTTNRAIVSAAGKIGRKGKKQTFFCVTYVAEEEVIVGCASGELYRFRGNCCTDIVQAHGVREPVLSIFYNVKEGVLITGGKDALIKTWTIFLQEVGNAVDMSEDLDGDGKPDTGSLDSAVISVQSLRNRLLIGTRGSDIFEAIVPANPAETHSLTRVAFGHSGGELLGLAAHPSKDIFATCGSDKTVRVWSVRLKDQTNMRQLPSGGSAVAFNPSGEILAVGMTDGALGLMEASHPALRVYATWKHASQPILDIKFAPSSEYMAASCADSNIYVYKSEDKRKYRRFSVCRGHTTAVRHLDFSANSQFIQSDSSDGSLHFWDVRGNLVKSASTMRDTAWATQTCVFGWGVQGIWAPGSSYNEINTCMALPDVGDIITGDDYCRVNLLRYPSLVHGALHQSYVGHSSHVSSVRFNYNRRLVISIGGADRTALLWKHETELAENSTDDAGSASSNSSASSDAEMDEVDPAKEVADVGERSLLLEAANKNHSTEEMAQILKLELANAAAAGAAVEAVKPWKSVVVEPTRYAPAEGTSDCDLQLTWVHGYRSGDCRNNLFYSASGAIVYTAAAVGIVYTKSTGKQRFLQGAHSDEILGLAAHPSAQIFATGEAGRNPQIVVWSSSNMRIMSRLTNSHSRGVPLLAFNKRGNFLASIGLDGDSTLVVHDWAQNILIMKTPTDRGKVLCLCFQHDEITAKSAKKESKSVGQATPQQQQQQDIIITAGAKHLKFWWSQGQNVHSQRGLWGKFQRHRRGTIMCVASGSVGVCVSGSAEGELLIWKDFKVVRSVKPTFVESREDFPKIPIQPIRKFPHSSPIQALWAIPGEVSPLLSYDHQDEREQPFLIGLESSARYITGDKMGVVAMWRLMVDHDDNLELVCVKVLHADNLQPPPQAHSIRAVCERDGMIIIGTSASEVYEIPDEAIPVLNFPLPVSSRHGIEPTPTKPPPPPPPPAGGAVAAGVGGGVSGSKVAPLDLSSLKYDKTHDGHFDETLPAQLLVSGHSSGEVWGLVAHPHHNVFFTAGDDLTIRCWRLEDRRNELMSFTVTTEKCRAIDISPDGEYLAAALNDGKIWILKVECFLRNEGTQKFDKIDPTFKAKQIEFVEPEVTKTKGLMLLSENKLILVTAGTQWSQEIKFSFDGNILAVGSHDSKVYLFVAQGVYKPVDVPAALGADAAKKDEAGDAKKDDKVAAKADEKVDAKADDKAAVKVDTWGQKWATAEVISCEGHSSYVTHIDFGVKLTQSTGTGQWDTFDEKSCTVVTRPMATQRGENTVGAGSARGPARRIALKDICIQSTSGAHELLFWDGRGKRIESASVVKDAWWATWTSPLGWPVQGIWADRPDGTEVSAVARSHSWSTVPVLACVDNFGRVKLYNYPCITAGAPDKRYRGHAHHVTNVRFSHDDAYCITVGGTDRCVFVWKTDIQEEMRARQAWPTSIRAKGDESMSSGNEDADLCASLAIVEAAAASSRNSDGDSTASGMQPWRAAVREPSEWTDPPGLGGEPNASLELRFVYGYRGWDCRNNIGYADSSVEIVYHIAGVGIVYNSEEHKQVLNTDHDHSITCLAVHPDGHTVATGEHGGNSLIILWDANTGVYVRKIGYHRKGVSHVAFSASGVLLVSVGMDDDRTVVVHNARTGAVVGAGKAGRNMDLFTLAVGGDENFVTAGRNHIKFWELPAPTHPGGELASQQGIFNKAVTAKTTVSSAYLGTDAVTGMADGKLLLWKDRQNTRQAQGHDGPVTAMCTVPQLSGLGGGSSEAGIISGGDDGLVTVWNMQLSKVWTLNLKETTPISTCPKIQALATKDGKILIGTKASEIFEANVLKNETFRFVEGHFDTKAEVCGLAVQPKGAKFVTTSDDMTVRVWDAKAMRQKEIATLGVRVRSAAYSPDGSQIVFGTVDGRVKVLSADLKKAVADVSVASANIEVLVFSPDGRTLAAGSQDTYIYLLDGKSFSCRAHCSGHTSLLTGIDFSYDNSTLQSSSSTFELLFWDAAEGSLIASPTETRDVAWEQTTCPLGWAVQGVWPADFRSPVNVRTVGRSPRAPFLASGDDSNAVKLYQFPCPSLQSKSKAYKGHSCSPARVRFTSDGKYVISVGGLDKAVMQWEVILGPGARLKR